LQELAELKGRLFELNQERRRIKREIRKMEPGKTPLHEKAINSIAVLGSLVGIVSILLLLFKGLGVI